MQLGGKTFVTERQRQLEVSLKVVTRSFYLWGCSIYGAMDKGGLRALSMRARGADPLRYVCWWTCLKWQFDTFMFVVVCVSTVVMATVHEGQTERHTEILWYLEITFTIIFFLEAMVKVVGKGWTAYWVDSWNRFDFLVMLMSSCELVLKLSASSLGTLAIGPVLRSLRISRMFKIVGKFKGLRVLFNTLLMSLPALYNVGTLLFLVCFVYAVVGMAFFGEVDGYEDGAINEHANFWYFGNALLTVLRIVTGDNWGALLADIMNCNDGGYPNWECGIPVFPLIYFCTLIGLCSAIMLNLIVAIIIDKFIQNASEEGLLKEGDGLKNESILDVLRRIAYLDIFTMALKRKIVAARAYSIEEEEEEVEDLGNQ
eukprot:gene14253-16855_t